MKKKTEHRKMKAVDHLRELCLLSNVMYQRIFGR